MKTYIIQTTDMTDKIQLELMKYTKGCVGELSRLGNLYTLSTDKKNIEQIKKLPFVRLVEEDCKYLFDIKS